MGQAGQDREGVPTGRTELFTKGVLNGFLHNAYTAHKGGTASTGNGKRGYRSPPGVGTTNFFLDAGASPRDELLRRADGGVLIQDVSGVHSGSGGFSERSSCTSTERTLARYSSIFSASRPLARSRRWPLRATRTARTRSV